MSSLSTEMIICCVSRSSLWEIPSLSACSGLLKFSSSNMNPMNFKIVFKNNPKENLQMLKKEFIVLISNVGRMILNSYPKSRDLMNKHNKEISQTCSGKHCSICRSKYLLWLNKITIVCMSVENS